LADILGQLPLEQHIGVRIPGGQPMPDPTHLFELSPLLPSPKSRLVGKTRLLHHVFILSGKRNLEQPL
jgi:hypothetical protein